MAKLSSKPDFSIVGRLKPPLDFYQWLGIWCVRVYPLHIHQPGTPAQQETWNAMLACVDDYNELAAVDRKAWHRFVRDSHRSGKDLFYRLHLKGQTDAAQPWSQVFLDSVSQLMGMVTIRFKTDKLCKCTLSYCWNKQQKTAYYWRKEGYCIRGRKFIRKRRLSENWQYTKVQAEPRVSKDHTFNFLIGPGWRYITFTIRECEHASVNYRGRAGVFRFDEGEVYP